MTRTAKIILRDRQREEAEASAENGLEPFSPDHKIYPQGWSWAMIEREASRRYRPERDAERAQEWVWAVDAPPVRKRLAHDAIVAAHALYDHQQAAVGDVEHIETPRVFVDGGFQYLGASWAQQRSLAIASAAKNYVYAHPDLTPARRAVFDCLFEEKQPTIEDIRCRAWVTGVRINAKGKYIRLNHREVVDRVVWCCDVLADRELDLTRSYGAAA